jgi:hypothetical protein
MTLEDQFIAKIRPHLLHYKFNGKVHQFFCPYCQSSGINSKGKRLSPSEGRGYFYPKGRAINFGCKRCGEGMQFHNFLKGNFPGAFVEYVKERDRRGTTGYQTNCPTLDNVLIDKGLIGSEKPVFNADPEPSLNQNQNSKELRSSQGDDPEFILHEGRPYKLTKCSPATTPQALAGHGAPINKIMNERERRRRQQRGELW